MDFQFLPETMGLFKRVSGKSARFRICRKPPGAVGQHVPATDQAMGPMASR